MTQVDLQVDSPSNYGECAGTAYLGGAEIRLLFASFLIVCLQDLPVVAQH